MPRLRRIQWLLHTMSLGAALLFATESAAQLRRTREAENRSNTLHTAVGVQLNAATLNFNGDNMEVGMGAGVFAGWGFTGKIMLFGQYDAARVDINATGLAGTYTLAHSELGIRYTFANEKRAWIPYASGAVSGRQASTQQPSIGGTQDFSFSGPGFTFGGGTQYFMTRMFALDMGMQYAFGKLGTVKIGGSRVRSTGAKNSTSVRFAFGLKFYPQVPKEE